MKRILFVTFLHGLICCVYSQQKYTFTTYSQEQGLPSGTIRGIYKDTTGYIWLTSEGGVSRFNGHSFKTFRHNPDISTSLPTNVAWYGGFPRFGDIYFNTEPRYCKYNPATESFSFNTPFGDTVGYFLIEEAKAVKECYWVKSKSTIFKINKTGTEHFPIPFEIDPRVWIMKPSYGKGVMLYKTFKSKANILFMDEQTKNFSRIKILDREGLEDSSIIGDVIFTNNNFYLFTGKTLYRFNSAAKYFEWYCDLKQAGNFDYEYTIILPYNDSLVVLRSKSGFLNIFNIRTGKEKLVYVNKKIPEAELHDRTILAFAPDTDGGLWMGTIEMGIIYYNLFTGELEQFVHQAGNVNSLPGNFFEAIFPDENGIIWASCFGHGLVKMEPVTAIFKTTVPTGTKNLNKSAVGWTANIRGFVETDDGHWIATMDGLFHYSNKTQQFSDLKKLLPASPTGNSDFNREVSSSSPVGSFAKDQAGNLWIGTWYGDLVVHNTNLNRSFVFQRPQALKDRDNTGVFRNLFCDKKNRMWISTYGGGICRIDCNSLDFEKINETKFECTFFDEEDSTSLPTDQGFLVTEDAQGNIWAGTQNGLCRWNEQTGKWKRFYNSPGNPNSLHHNDVRSMCLDKKGRLWIGTNGGGLNRYNEDQDNFTHFTTENGLPDDQVYSLLCDDNGMLWMGTNRGLCRFNPDDHSCKNFTEKDGIQNYEYNTGAALKLKNGELLIGGIAGYNIIDPNKIENKTSAPPVVVISSFKIFDKEIPPGNNIFKLNYKENNLAFEFAALSYFQNQEIRYAYMLEGVDRDWVYTQARRYVSYPKLEPGTYTFRVKASNSDGVWNETGARVQITIRPPWWKTSWAYTLYALLFAGLLVGYALFIRKREKEKIVQVRKEAELKLQSLRAQLNPHFMFNSLTAIHDLILTDQAERSRKYLIRFSKLLRMLLENAEQPFVSLNSELELIDIYLSLEKLRLADLEYSITTDPSIDMTETYLPNMILQPYIENSLWHGLSHKQGDRKLELNVYKKNGAVIYDVKDNGVGRKRSAELKSSYRKEHKSKGMELLNDRFKLLRDEFGSEIKTEIVDVADNGEVKGTQVIITVPDSLFRKK